MVDRKRVGSFSPSSSESQAHRSPATGKPFADQRGFPTGPTAALCAIAEEVRHPKMAKASWINQSFSSAATMNRAKPTRRVRLLARMGSPICWLHTGGPWLSSLQDHCRARLSSGLVWQITVGGFHLVINFHGAQHLSYHYRCALNKREYSSLLTARTCL